MSNHSIDTIKSRTTYTYLEFPALGLCNHCDNRTELRHDKIVVVVSNNGNDFYRNDYYVHCPYCESRGPISNNSLDGAILLWRYPKNPKLVR